MGDKKPLRQPGFGRKPSAGRPPMGMLGRKMVGEYITDFDMTKYLNYVDGVSSVAPHWYIRHGARDRDTAFSVSINLATKLQNSGKDVSFKLPWNRPHSGDYALNELFAWLAEIL